ncbi:MAG TPA: hypothetical protein VFS92_10655 [Planctomycetota bacterium]|nr:hypothetical protein [Planctomycetota bacterium]
MTPPTSIDPGRASRAGRVLRILILTAFLLHLGIALAGWFQATGVTVIGGRREVRELSMVIDDCISYAAGVLALVALAILLLSGWRRPRGARIRLVPWEWPLAGALVVVAALLPLRGRFDVLTGQRLPVTWIQRAACTGVLLAAVATLVVLQLTIAYLMSRGPGRAERREGIRDALALWGFLLLAGAMLGLEWRTMDLTHEMRILGARAPAWVSLPSHWFEAVRLPLAFAFVGLVATLFGAWHLRRRDPPGSPVDVDSVPPA